MLLLFADRARLRRAAGDRRMQAFRPGTRANQLSHVLLFVAFTIHFGFTDFPAAANVLILFAEFLLRGYAAAKSATNAISSLRTFHLLQGFATQGFDHVHLAMWKRALPFTCRHVPSPAPAFPLPLLVRLCAAARDLGGRGVAFAALLATGFFSLARLSSLVPGGRRSLDATRVPLLADLVFTEAGAELFVKWGKSRQDPAEGFWVPLRPVSGSPACPVTCLRALLAGLRGAQFTLPLFAYRSRGRGSVFQFFTMGEARAWLATLLHREGLPARAFTFHSLRRGGCSFAFAGGAAREDLQLLGGWSSRAVDAYLPSASARERAAEVLARSSEEVLQ